MNHAKLRLLGLLAEQQQDAARPKTRRDTMKGYSPVTAVTGFNLFQTPPALAKSLVDHCQIASGHRVLEPSVGMGRCLVGMPDGCTVQAYDSSTDCCDYIFERYPAVRVSCCDFLIVNPAPIFDRVVMNPPFSRGADVKHILHAFKFLRDGGRLVALCFDGVAQNKKLRPLVDEWEPLGAGLFAGTQAAVVMVTMNK